MASSRGSVSGAILLSLAAALAVLAADFAPARLADGSRPQMPVKTVGWTDVRLEVIVDVDGAVSRTTPFRVTPGALPFVEPVVASWRFRPALYLDKRLESAVLVVTMFRPPQLFDDAPGSPPVDVASPSEAVPFPILEARPKYPPNGFGDGVVLVEVLVGIDGKVEQAGLVGSGAGFENAALEAARGWVFSPARYRGQPVPAYAYLIFGFRAPVVAPPIRGLG
jgi:TonB family protein